MNRNETAADVHVAGHTHHFTELDNFGYPTGFYACEEPTCIHGLAGPWLHGHGARLVSSFDAQMLDGGLSISFAAVPADSGGSG